VSDEGTYLKVVSTVNEEEAGNAAPLSDPADFVEQTEKPDEDGDPLTKAYTAQSSYLVQFGSPKNLAWAFSIEGLANIESTGVIPTSVSELAHFILLLTD